MARDADRLNAILRKFENVDASEHYSQLEVIKKIQGGHVFHPKRLRRFLGIGSGVFFVYLLWSSMSVSSKGCLVDMPQSSSKIFRQPEYCDICEDVTTVDRVSNISSLRFYEEYVKPAKPVVVVKGAADWPAMDAFSFDFFKSVYQELDLNSNPKKRCQFFPYETEFRSLGDVFKMEPGRAGLEPGHAPWYVGWSNCAGGAGRALGRFYASPPLALAAANRVEGAALTWTFIGGPGRGAHLHVDDVGRPSWQAQLRGRKKWRLAPPPECRFRCSGIAGGLEVVLEPGDVIVVDTNRWYHQTEVLPDQVSITIGSEFD